MGDPSTMPFKGTSNRHLFGHFGECKGASVKKMETDSFGGTKPPCSSHYQAREKGSSNPEAHHFTRIVIFLRWLGLHELLHH